MTSLALKLTLCLLVASAARAADEDSDNDGRYDPELYEKPYETAETEEPITESTEATEATETPEPSEKSESEAPTDPAPQPEVVAADSPVAVAPFPYPLLFAHQYGPLIYSAPHFLTPAVFPTVVL